MVVDLLLLATPRIAPPPKTWPPGPAPESFDEDADFASTWVSEFVASPVAGGVDVPAFCESGRPVTCGVLAPPGPAWRTPPPGAPTIFGWLICPNAPPACAPCPGSCPTLCPIPPSPK